METKVANLTSKKFGTIRRIIEGENVLFCASDVAKALGYANANKAIATHCVGTAKRRTTISSGRKMEINFIPESDVYRLICHSKLPSAMEFEKWVFEDVVPKAVRKTKGIEEPKIPQAEQLTLETSEYHYFDKSFNGLRVITIADFLHFTNASLSRVFVTRLIKENCVIGKDYFILRGKEIALFKIRHPQFNKKINVVFLIAKTGVEKIIGDLKKNAEIGKLFLESNIPQLPEKSSSVVEVSLKQEPVQKQHDNLFAKYEKLGTYTKERIDRLLEKRGVYVHGSNCLPLSIAKDFFIPLAVDTAILDENGGQTCIDKITTVNDRWSADEDYICELKVLNRKGIERLASIHNSFLTGEITFYKKGEAPVKYS